MNGYETTLAFAILVGLDINSSAWEILSEQEMEMVDRLVGMFQDPDQQGYPPEQHWALPHEDVRVLEWAERSGFLRRKEDR